MRFSARFAASKGDQAVVLEDAPRPTRIGFIKSLLGNFVGEARGGYGGKREPLDPLEVHQAFIALIRDESDPWDYSHENAWSALTEHLKSCTWLDFYDFVELLGKQLIKYEENLPFSETDHFVSYQAKLNALFEEDRIGWSLNEKSELHRQIPRALASRVKSTADQLSDSYANARIHYQKAITYLYQHPIDEANSIKEIVSALESVSKVLAPKASTLGDAIKHLRKQENYSSHLLDALEKLYIYSNATPLVRHGHVGGRRPPLAEAELSLHIGVAFIRYLMQTHEQAAK
jgi:hypothetical protein